MEMSISQAVIKAQILIDCDWVFLDEGSTNKILKVWNKSTDEKIVFENENEFENWLSEKTIY